MSIVPPILEYPSVIWDPIYKTHSDRIESVQKQFLLFCLRSLNFSYDNLPPYIDRLSLIKLPTLASRRKMLNVSFLYNVIMGDISAGFLVNNINFNVPQRTTRHYAPLAIQFSRMNYANADPLTRISKDFNAFYNFIDFTMDINTIKSKITMFLNSEF